jgi:predicted DNA-binding transcriptional regulator AlpA
LLATARVFFMPPQQVDVTSDAHSAPPTKLIFKRQLLERVPLSFTTIWRLTREGKFPRARQIGQRSVWVESEVEAFLQALPLREYLQLRAPSNAPTPTRRRRSGRR